MFDKEKFKNIDIIEYARKMKLETDKHFAIIDLINPENHSYPPLSDKLKGIPFGIKDNFAVRNSITSAASKIIREFKPNYTSTVYKKLIQHGAIPIAKTNLDELAMGGSGLTSNYGPVTHPHREGGLLGGSSSGSAYLVASGHLPFTIGSDTGDSIRKPAAYGGVVGFKPTWGLVSRYGVYDFAPTWDSVGWFTNTVKDSKDASSIHSKQSDYEKQLKTNKKFTFGKINSIIEEVVDKEIVENYNKILTKAENDGHRVIELNVNKEQDPDYIPSKGIKGFFDSIFR